MGDNTKMDHRETGFGCMGSDSYDTGQEPVAGSREQSNKMSVSIKHEEFDYLNVLIASQEEMFSVESVYSTCLQPVLGS